MLDDKSKNNLLERHIEELGTRHSTAGRTGGKVARWVTSKLTKCHDSTETLAYPARRKDALHACFETVMGMPTLLEFFHANLNAKPPYIAAVIGSGFQNMNPTVVWLECVATSETSTDIRITASAKEGLVNQKSGPNAIAALKQRLRAISADGTPLQ